MEDNRKLSNCTPGFCMSKRSCPNIYHLRSLRTEQYKYNPILFHLYTDRFESSNMNLNCNLMRVLCRLLLKSCRSRNLNPNNS